VEGPVVVDRARVEDRPVTGDGPRLDDGRITHAPYGDGAGLVRRSGHLRMRSTTGIGCSRLWL